MRNETLTNKTLDLANQYFDTATEQYCKPEEDLVPYMVCRSAYKATGNYLAAFMLHKGMEVKDEMTLDFLLQSCKVLDHSFNSLDIAPLAYGNAHHEETVFADDQAMRNYMGIAQETKKIVLNAW